MTQITNTSRDTIYDSLPCLSPTCAECPYVGADGNCGGDLPIFPDDGDMGGVRPIASEGHADEHDGQPIHTHTLILTPDERMFLEDLLCAAADNDDDQYQLIQGILVKM